MFRHRLALAVLCLPELTSTVRKVHRTTVDHITTAAFSHWWEHQWDFPVPVVTHLTRALPALGHVNGHIESAPGRQLSGMTHMNKSMSLLNWLLAPLRDANAKVRQTAALAVGKVGSAAATPEILTALSCLLQDDHLLIRQTATVALGKLGVAATPDYLSHPHPVFMLMERFTRESAADLLRGPYGVIDASTQFAIWGPILQDADPRTRDVAARGIWTIMEQGMRVLLDPGGRPIVCRVEDLSRLG